MTDETTTEQLPEIEGQTESTPVTGYTPPEGWRVVQAGEVLRDGDLWVNHEGELWPTKRVGERVNDERYIRPIEPQPQPQPESVQVREGRWRTRGGEIRNVTPTPAADGRRDLFPWWDAAYGGTWTSGGRYYFGEESPLDLVDYLGPIEPDKTQELDGKTQELPDKTQELPEYTPPEGWRVVRFGEQLLPGDHWVNWEGTVSRPDILHGDGTTASGGRYIRRIKPEPESEPQPQPQPQAATIEELRSEVSYVQRLLGESRQRVTQLEELVGSLRNINLTQEKAFTAAGKENTALRNQLAAVKAELASVAADRQQLRVELDAAQQVPADSPELRQLRADLEQVTQERDQHLDSYQRIFGDLETIRETTKAAAVEAIAEWLEPVRLVDNEHLANETLQHLPQIMRHLAGLDSHAID